jgi:hypothetical protein
MFAMWRNSFIYKIFVDFVGPRSGCGFVISIRTNEDPKHCTVFAFAYLEKVEVSGLSTCYYPLVLFRLVSDIAESDSIIISKS